MTILKKFLPFCVISSEMAILKILSPYCAISPEI